MIMKQKTIISYSLLLVAIISMAVTGCRKSFLDVEPQGKEPGATFWASETDAIQAVNAIYANLREWNNVAFAPIAVESLGSDDTEKGSSTGDATFLNQYDDFTVTSTEGQLNGFWTGQYQNINLCNQVIDRVDTMSTVTPSLKTRFIAEAKFVRAYSYFRLVRAFGAVPLRLHLPKDASEYNLPRTDTTTVWNAIEQDLTDAASVLPNSYTGANVGRATKGAALALHAKVAMYRGKWSDVLSYTTQVMGLGYSLYPDYEAMFRIPNENCSESVFEIQSALIPGNSGASNSQYSQVQGVRGSAGGGWGFNVPTTSLVNAYEPNDPRQDATILFRGETTPQGDVIPAVGDNPRYNQKSYVPFSLFVSGYNEGCQQNIRVIRYADVLLMNAEANNELGNTTAALTSLNAVRIRARGSNPATVLPNVTVTDKAALRTAIWNERRVELAMEFDRYFDVIRQGRALAVFGPKGWKANKNEVWPIPQAEIDKSAGVLTQNKGY